MWGKRACALHIVRRGEEAGEMGRDKGRKGVTRGHGTGKGLAYWHEGAG